ncbi:MAG TPA: TonB-dependent receptor [Sphingomonas sp.]
MTRKARKLVISSTISIWALASSLSAAGAQTAAQPATQAGAAEAAPSEDLTPADIIITGSRIARPELDNPNPVEVISAERIERSGDTNLTEFLRDSPALVGSLSDQLNSGSNASFQSVGVNLLNLRNLGTQRTLVLINGRRHVNAFPGENSVDTNTIPIDLIERVDVLTGGVSAIYGADGVSGVVNFVLKRKFEGLRARTQFGISELGDAGNRYGSLLVGKNFAADRGNITFSYEYNDADRLSERKRSYLGDATKRLELLRDPADFPDNPNVPDRILFNNVSWADSAPNGAVDVDFDGVPDFEGGGRVYDRGIPLASTGGRAINSTSNTPNAGYFGDQRPAIERHNFNVLSSFEFSPAARLFVEGKYVKTRAYTEAQPSFDFGTYLRPDNPYLIDQFGALAPDGAFVNRDNYDFGTNRQRASRDTIRSVIGFDGDLTQGAGSGNLHYEVSYVFGRASSRATYENGRVTDRYYAALDAVPNPATGQVTCRINLAGEMVIDQNNYGGVAQVQGVTVNGAPLSFSPGQCLPLNILGEGVSSQAAIDFVFVDSTNRAHSTQHVLSGTLSGDLGFLFELPGGAIGVAAGGEYRKESTRSTPSAFQQAGYFDGGSAILASGGSYDVKEAYAEINVPLLKDLPFVQSLSLGGAVRYSDYSTIGSTLTWKIDGTYSPVRDITVRGTYSQAVRAPNITELFSPQQGIFAFLSDPCDPIFIGEGTQYRVANCQAVLTNAGLTPTQIANFSPSTDAEQSTGQPGLTGGNPDLSEETARTWTAGVVLRPSFLPNFSLTADWYNIKLKNAINTPDVNNVFELCVDQPTIANQFCSQFTRNSANGFINSFVVQAQNVAAFTTSGLEIGLSYQLETTQLGTFNLAINGGYLDDLTFIATVGGVPEQEKGRTYRPRYIGTGDLTWTNGPLTINYGLSWQDKTQRFTAQQLRSNPDSSDPKYFLYKERWEHDARVSLDVDDRFTFFAGVNNFSNQKPAIAAGGGVPVSVIGRYLFAGARIKLPRF